MVSCSDVTKSFEYPQDLIRLLFQPSSEGQKHVQDGLQPSSAPIPIKTGYIGPVAVAFTPDVAHGRGLVTTRDVESGDVLFIIPPTISADWQQVVRLYQNGGANNKRLEEIAETVLLKEMKRAVRRNVPVANSFLALQSQHHPDNEVDWSGGTDDRIGSNLLDTLLGQNPSGDALADTRQRLPEGTTNVDDNEYLLGIIRQNAFGPDFHHYDRMEREIAQGRSSSYHRILGHYPLAAMINHSCTTNATRVFCCTQTGESMMLATATKKISKGEEVLWSYIPPTNDYATRQAQIQHYGFTCRCSRCLQEESALVVKSPPSVPIDHSKLSILQWTKLIQSLDDWYSSASADHSTTRCLRLGYSPLYIAYFNAALQEAQRLTQQSPSESSRLLHSVMQQATHLHFAFEAVHPACTEHLSILHLCYELASAQKDATKALFWTEQLKHAHMARYSRDAIIGNDGGNTGETTQLQQQQQQQLRLRQLFQHTKLILRNPDGWHHATFQSL